MYNAEKRVSSCDDLATRVKTAVLTVYLEEILGSYESCSRHGEKSGHP